MAGSVYRFGHCELNAVLRTLHVDGQKIDLQPRVFDLLLYLVERPGILVTKDELLQNVWQRLVSETVVARTVMKARKAIGDDAADPRFILTQYGSGYRFVGQVEQVADAGVAFPGPEPEETTPSPPVPVPAEAGATAAKRRRRWPRYVLPLVGVLAVVALLATFMLSSGPARTSGLKRLAVLPVVDATGDGSLGWARLGLMSMVGEAVQARLAVDLASPQEVLSVLGAVPGQAMDEARLEEARKRLNADALVLLRLFRAEDLLGLEVTLYQHGHKSPLAALTDAHATTLGPQAAQAVARALRPSDGHRELAPGQWVSPDPYVNEAYARALDAMAGSRYDAAAELLQVVVREVADQPGPRVRLAQALNSSGRHKEALEQARQAVELAGRSRNRGLLARGYREAAWANYQLGDFEAAQKDASKILKLVHAGDPEIKLLADGVLGVLAAERGQFAVARRLMEATVVGRQRLGSTYALAAAHYNLGVLLDQRQVDDTPSARLHLERAIEFARTSGRFNIQINALDRLANISLKQGNCAKALELVDAADVIERANKVKSASRVAGEIRVLCLAGSGRAKDALALAERLASAVDAETQPVSAAYHKITRATILSVLPGHSPSEVRALFAEAGELYRAMGMQAKYKDLLARRARYEIAQGRDGEASSLLAQAQSLEGDGVAVLEARAMQAYHRGDRRQALELLQEAVAENGRAEVAHTAITAWILLDQGQTAAAAERFGQIAAYRNGNTHEKVCLLEARLLYAGGEYREAADTQQGCIRRLGDRATPLDHAYLQAYTRSASGASPAPLPQQAPGHLWQ